MHKLSRQAYQTRRALGYTDEEARAYPGSVRYREKIELPDGRWYPNLNEMSRATGIGLSTLQYRRRNQNAARSIGDAPNQVSNAHARTINKKRFDSDKQACRHFNVNYTTFQRRRDRGWSVEQALGLNPSPKAIALTIDGVPHQTIRALADHYQQNRDSVRRKLARGATPRQAVGLDVFDGVVNPDGLLVDGVPYANIHALAAAYEKPVTTIRNRIESGMDPLEAVVKPVRTYRRKK